MQPFRPLLICAIIFGGLIRILECYILPTSTWPTFVEIWQRESGQVLSLSNGIRYCCLLFLVVATLQLMEDRKCVANRAAFVFCLILAFYGWSLDHFSDRMDFQQGGGSVDPGRPLESP